MTQDNANVYDDTTKLMMDEFGGIHVVGFGENILVATVARDAEMPWKRNHSLIVDLMIYRFNREHRPDSTHPTQNNTGGDAAATPIGAAWMREQAAIACSVVATEAKEYKLAEMSLGASACCEAIRALPLPTDADLLAEAMKLPEVAALVEAAQNMRASYIPFVEDEFRATYAIDAALAPFTAAKETP